MLDFSKTVDRLAMTASVRLCRHVLWREDGRVLRMALDFDVECQRKKCSMKRMWKKQVEEELMMVGLSK